MSQERLPIDDVLPDVLRALDDAGCVVLRAATGAGKTTRVPPALVDADARGNGKVIVIEPRRIAARAAARRVAFERGGRVGDEIGYRVRFDARPGTQVEFVTEGIFLRMLQADPLLEAVGAVVFDEFHERNLDSDLALAMVHRVRTEVRPDLRIVVMSATLDPAPLVRFLGDCPHVESKGRLHPVEIRHVPKKPEARLEETVARAVTSVLDETPGDVLVFLPGVGEIRRAAKTLGHVCEQRGIDVRELYGDLPPDRQDGALRRGSRRRVVLATNVAETSVTVEGVTAVVDTGLARRPRFEASLGLPRLTLGPISKASAEQRAGRAGRTAPGICMRLWTANEHRSRPEREEPEIRRADLAATALQLLAWGERDLAAFPWFEPPDDRALGVAVDLLQLLGAIDDAGAITPRGTELSRLPVHPRLGVLLHEGMRLGDAAGGAMAAALLAERDPFRWRDEAPFHAASDVVERVEALEAFARTGSTSTTLGTLARTGARFVVKARDQLSRLLRDGGPPPKTTSPDALERAILAAFPDRVARRRRLGESRAVMVGGRGVRLHSASVVAVPEFFVCVDVDAGRRGERSEAVVRMASAIRRDWLADRLVTKGWDVSFDAESERVTAVRRTRYLDLVLDAAPTAPKRDEETAEVLAAAATDDLATALPLDAPGVAGFLSRVRCLAEWMPELALPVFDDDHLRALLPALCRGRRSFAELRKAPLLDHLRGALSHQQSRALESHAPERIKVPSGSRVTLRYEPGRPPVLAVRIQEVFGLAQTPRVAAGRVAVLLHLLAPNMRPQQITDDLASFWANTYTTVRKELRARYPRHAWPEDPTAAQPQRRPRRRRSR